MSQAPNILSVPLTVQEKAEFARARAKALLAALVNTPEGHGNLAADAFVDTMLAAVHYEMAALQEASRRAGK